MDLTDLLAPAAANAVRIVAAVPADLLDAPTPCDGWDVRTELNHLVYWTGRGGPAARKEGPGDGPGEDHDFTADPGFADHFAAVAEDAARAWRDPAAWTGNASLTGDGPGMPAPVIGGMVFGEWVLHGWDLAVATGRPHGITDEIARAAYDGAASIAAMAREYGAFGPEVAVPADAPVLDRLLGVTGRDPRWKP
ncbi:TIGR03086 family metal-binding protein [Actinomadura atramentaria]|uniref:TIGR03086 family metal-binding protein n=1 Tax=Actinomadura atramentaria TaxID=1990 RepID=UPI0003686FC2|nr:TIGR03086 family metal-binding protein [Actinomadura atramentaria]